MSTGIRHRSEGLLKSIYNAKTRVPSQVSVDAPCGGDRHTTCKSATDHSDRNSERCGGGAPDRGERHRAGHKDRNTDRHRRQIQSGGRVESQTPILIHRFRDRGTQRRGPQPYKCRDERVGRITQRGRGDRLRHHGQEGADLSRVAHRRERLPDRKLHGPLDDDPGQGARRVNHQHRSRRPQQHGQHPDPRCVIAFGRTRPADCD